MIKIPNEIHLGSSIGSKDEKEEEMYSCERVNRSGKCICTGKDCVGYKSKWYEDILDIGLMEKCPLYSDSRGSLPERWEIAITKFRGGNPSRLVRDVVDASKELSSILESKKQGLFRAVEDKRKNL